MAAKLITLIATDFNGNVLNGAKLNVYDAGTTDRRAIYTTSALSAQDTNPATATSDGTLSVWVDDSGGDIYITVTDSAAANTYFDLDNIDIATLSAVPIITYQGDQSLNTTDSPTFAGLTLGAVSFGGVVTDPNADRILFWDDSDSQVEFLSLGTGLSITANTLSLDGDLEDISGLTPSDGAIIIGDGTDFVTESGATARASLGVTIGSDVQAYDANLTAFVGAFTAPTVDGTAGQFLKTDGAGTLTFATPAGGGDLLAAAAETVTGNWTVSGAWTFSGNQAFTGDIDLSSVPNASKRGILDDLAVDNVFYAELYGVSATVASDQASGIQAAIDAAEANGGGVVQLPKGRIRIDTGLTITESNVVLQGVGSDANHDTTHDDVGTILAAYGSGMTMLSVNSPSGASEFRRYGSGVRMVEFEGLGTAAVGIEYISVNAAVCENVRVTNCTSAQIQTSSRATFGESSDMQNCYWRNITLRMGDSAASQSAKGLVLDGASGAGNFSWNQIHNLQIRHHSGIGIHCISADNCRFSHVRLARPTGTGNGIVVNGRETGVKVIDNLRFLHVVSQAPILVQGTADGFAEDAVGVYFLIDQSNSSAEPTISAGVDCVWERGDGYLNNQTFVEAAFGNSAASAQAARENIGTASAMFANGSGNNVRLSGSDGTSNVYGFNVASSGGALRLQRLAGSADFEVSFPVDLSSTLNVTGIATVANGFSVGDDTAASDQQMYIRANSAYKSILNCADESGNFVGGFQYDHTIDTMNIRAGGQGRVSVNNATFAPVTDSALTLGTTGLRWSTTYSDNYEATTAYSVGGTQVVGAQQSAIVSLTDNTGVTHDDTIADASLTDSSGGTTDGTVSAVSGTSADATINNNFAECVASINALEANDSDLAAKVEEILTALRTHGLIGT